MARHDQTELNIRAGRRPKQNTIIDQHTQYPEDSNASPLFPYLHTQRPTGALLLRQTFPFLVWPLILKLEDNFSVLAQTLMITVVHFQNLKLIKNPHFYCNSLDCGEQRLYLECSSWQPALCIGLHLNIKCRWLNYCIIMQTPYGIHGPKNINHFPKLLIPCTSVLGYYKALQLQRFFWKL